MTWKFLYFHDLKCVWKIILKHELRFYALLRKQNYWYPIKSYIAQTQHKILYMSNYFTVPTNRSTVIPKLYILHNLFFVKASMLLFSVGYSLYSDWLWAGRPRGRSSSSGRIKRLSSPYRPGRLWGPTSLTSNGYQGFLSGVKWPRHEADHPIQLVSRSRIRGSIHPLSYTSSRSSALLSTGTTLSYHSLAKHFYRPIAFTVLWGKGFWERDLD
jgi:hypothetical protein